MIHKMTRILWGDLSADEFKKISILSVTLMIILGNYWMMRALKDALFSDLVGFRYQPVAKIVSLIVVVFIVLGYSKLVDVVKKHNLFYLLCPLYSGLFFLSSFSANYPDVFSVAQSSYLAPFVAWIPGKFMGWFTYVLFESSSLIIIIFWSLVASTTSTELAKKGYGIMLFVAQIGTVGGTAAVLYFSQAVGAPTMVSIGAILFLIVPFLIKIYMNIIFKEHLEIASKPEIASKSGFWEGLRLLITKPYVAGIFFIATIHSVITIVMEFQMKMIAVSEVYQSRDAFAAFCGKFGMSVNFITLIFSLLGTSFFLRKFGIRFCLVTFPIFVGGIVSVVFFANNGLNLSSNQMMWLIFVSMVFIRGLSYSLNNPTKEVMYIPTSDDIKFKAKGWIDMFGTRSAKGTGALINTMFGHSMSTLMVYGLMVSFGFVAIWLVIAIAVGRIFNRLQDDGTIVK
jgi:ATP:ADP antiporter, AAA family